MLDGPLGFLERFRFRAGRTGDLAHIEGAGDAAALGMLLDRDVVGNQHRAYFNTLGLGHFRGDVEIHRVASIVTVHEQNTFAATDGLDRLEDDIGRRRGEDVAANRCIGPAIADEGRVHGLMARATADQQRNLPVRNVVAHDRIDARYFLQLAMGCENQSVDDFGNNILRIVDDLLHDRSR